MTRTIALAGNPNSGKTTLFNKLTGLNHKVGNYPGVTVERRAGKAKFAELTVVDLPGTYSLISRSRDEAIAFEVLSGRSAEPPPDLVVIVVDASNLDRNLYLALSILELGRPSLIALNMMDAAAEAGLVVDPGALEEALGVPVVPIVARNGEGIDALEAEIVEALEAEAQPTARTFRLSDEDEASIAEVAKLTGDAVAVWILSSLGASRGDVSDDPLAGVASSVRSVAERVLPSKDFPARVIEARYAVARRIAAQAVAREDRIAESLTDRLDAVLLHPIAGIGFFFVVMAILFQTIFAWAQPLMDAIEFAMGVSQSSLRAILPSGAIVDLLSDGVVGGVGNVLVFIPQIAFLFFFIAILEDSGYLARAAFISDRAMARVGLHGRAFVPLLSSFACAVPAIMATRTIESRRDRLVTIMVAPLISCSARLPVYSLIIASLFAADVPVLGFLSLGGLLLFAMYLLSIAAAITAAFVLKRTVLASPTPPLVLELPPYRRPDFASVLRRVLERCKVFVRDAGTIILACSIVLWAMLYFPREIDATDLERRRAMIVSGSGSKDAIAEIDRHIDAKRLEGSIAGRIGKAFEPVIAPLGFDWKIGIGLLASFAAREVLVSTLGLVYGVGEADEDSQSLRSAIRAEIDPRTGRPVYTPLVGLALMVFFVLACQCMSTLAIVRRETNSWRWPLFMFGYMTVLAWCGSFVVYQVGRAAGFG